MIYVGKGNRFVTRINAARSNFGGDLVFEAKDLPQGMKLISHGMNSSTNTGLISFEAAQDAPIGGKLIDLVARHADQEKYQWPLLSTIGFCISTNRILQNTCEEARRCGCRRDHSNSILYHRRYPWSEMDHLALKWLPKEKGFDAPITVRMLWNPPELALNRQCKFQRQNEVTYTINAG